MNLDVILAQSNITFGTSGARGLVTDFTDIVCAAFTQSFVSVMRQSFTFDRIAIAIDNRPSSPQMAAACTGMLIALGISVDYYGVLPTPALAYKAMQDGIPSIMITGSHIPFDRNGIKFYRPDGEISKADESLILNVEEAIQDFSPELLAANASAADYYIARYLDVFPAGVLKGKHIGIYEHSSAGRDIYHKVFTALGANVTSLGRSDSFVPIDTEAVSEEDKVRAKTWSIEHNFDAIFSTDGDGDRPLLADEQGEWLRGDIVGLLCAKLLGIDALSVPVNANTAIDLCGAFKKVVRTRIGSPYVIAEFSELCQIYRSVAGFEANGGFLIASDISVFDSPLKSLPTRDALLPVITILVASTKTSVSKLVADLPQRFTVSDRLQYISQEAMKEVIHLATFSLNSFLGSIGIKNRTVEKIDRTDGIRWWFKDGSVMHIRPSGNAPELRFYTEGATSAIAIELLKSLISGVEQLVKEI